MNFVQKEQRKESIWSKLYLGSRDQLNKIWLTNDSHRSSESNGLKRVLLDNGPVFDFCTFSAQLLLAVDENICHLFFLTPPKKTKRVDECQSAAM